MAAAAPPETGQLELAKERCRRSGPMMLNKTGTVLTESGQFFLDPVLALVACLRSGEARKKKTTADGNPPAEPELIPWDAHPEGGINPRSDPIRSTFRRGKPLWSFFRVLVGCTNQEPSALETRGTSFGGSLN